MLLFKIVLLNKFLEIIGSCFLSGIAVMGRRLSATLLGLSKSMEDIAKILEELKNQSPLMYHPIHETSDKAWFPGNDAAQILVVISNTWEDINNILRIRNEQKSDYDKKLLLKFILIETRSILDQIDKLQGIVFRIIGERGKETSLHGNISSEEEEKIKIIFKKYHSIKRTVENDLLEIRNKIGAHRENSQLWKVGELWNKLDPKVFKPMFVEIPELINTLRKLDIYDWTRIPEENCIEIFTSGLGDYKF
jgi:hypothetical protein